MKIRSATFVASSAKHAQCPSSSQPELALMGRSNVGKSSLINMLLNNRKLAKISGTPGKTQLINHFLVNDAWYLVDLPGYGWARVSRTQKQGWQKMLKTYLLHRTQLVLVLVLIDSRHEPLKSDIALINWLGEHQIPFAILCTKVDKGSKQQTHKNLAILRKVLSEYWKALPDILMTSSKDKTGRKEVLNYIQATLDVYKN